ncbi:receptor accessory protein 5 [Nannochloropsis oceanica]
MAANSAIPTEDIKAKAQEIMRKGEVLIKSGIQKFSDDLEKVELLRKAEETTKVPKLYLVAATVFLGLSLFMFNAGAQFIVNVVGFVFPAYASFRALEAGDQAESKIWLAYWVVFGGTNLLDFFSEFITYWLPFYYLLKLALTVYLILPQFRGVEHLKKIIGKFGHFVTSKFE